MDAEVVIADAIVSSLAARKTCSRFLNGIKSDRRRLHEIYQQSSSFLVLVQSRAKEQSIDMFPNGEGISREWLERLPQRIREAGLAQDEEILTVAQKVLPYGNEAMEIVKKDFSDRNSSSHRDSLLGRAGLPGDPTTDAPPKK